MIVIKLTSRIVLLLAAAESWRNLYVKRHPLLADHAERWARFWMLPVLLFPLLLWPLYLFLYVIRHGRVVGPGADTILLTPAQVQMIVGGIGVMIAASLVLAGFARSVLDKFGDRRWTLLVIGMLSSGLAVYIVYVSSITAAMLGLTRGDNAVLTCFITVWAAAVGRVCSVAADRARDVLGIGFGRTPA